MFDYTPTTSKNVLEETKYSEINYEKRKRKKYNKKHVNNKKQIYYNKRLKSKIQNAFYTDYGKLIIQDFRSKKVYNRHINKNIINNVNNTLKGKITCDINDYDEYLPKYENVESMYYNKYEIQ